MCNNNNASQITNINTLQFIRKLRNFMHIIGMQSHYTIDRFRFRPNIINSNPVYIPTAQA